MVENLIIAAVAGIAMFAVEEFRHWRNSKQQSDAQAATKELLESADWEKRSFEIIKTRLGGFEDDELRKILVSVGAVRFKDGDGKELWGLRSRNKV